MCFLILLLLHLKAGEGWIPGSWVRMIKRCQRLQHAPSSQADKTPAPCEDSYCITGK